jgi:translocation protein SEC72
MEDPESFTLLPLRMDPQSKAISSTSSSRALTEELTTLNALHRSLLALDSPVPPPPIPVAPQRSAAIAKLRESANTQYRSSNISQALNLYTLGLDMALKRPLWEPSGLVRDEVAGLYANRAQAHMSQQMWVEGWKDAEASVEAKRVGNAKAWWRGGKCLVEMGRWEEARDWVGRGLEVAGREGELVALLGDIEGRLKRVEKK